MTSQFQCLTGHADLAPIGNQAADPFMVLLAIGLSLWHIILLREFQLWHSRIWALILPPLISVVDDLTLSLNSPLKRRY